MVHISPSNVMDHYVLYCEGELRGKQIRMAKLVGEGPASQRLQTLLPPPPPRASSS